MIASWSLLFVLLMGRMLGVIACSFNRKNFVFNMLLIVIVLYLLGPSELYRPWVYSDLGLKVDTTFQIM